MTTAQLADPRSSGPTDCQAGIERTNHNDRGGKGAVLSIHLLSPLFSGWAELEEPTLELPCWHESDGTLHTVRDLAVGQPEAQIREIYDRHADAVRRLVAASIAASLDGDDREARRLTSAASQLCEEVVGFWPISARGSGR
jgi:hypothetical protein